MSKTTLYITGAVLVAGSAFAYWYFILRKPAAIHVPPSAQNIKISSDTLKNGGQSEMVNKSVSLS